MTHPSSRLDDAVHQRTRLGILAVLCEGGRVDFTFLRTTLGLTDGNLSRSIGRLVEAGYVRSDKVVTAGRTRTWLTVTPDGRGALAAEVTALKELIARLDAPAPHLLARPVTDLG